MNIRGVFTSAGGVKAKRISKEWYNVQTAKEAFVYFNYFVHDATTEEIIKSFQMRYIIQSETTMRSVNVRYKSFCELSGKEYVPIKNEWSVITYENLYDEAVKNCPDIKMILEEKRKNFYQKNR